MVLQRNIASYNRVLCALNTEERVHHLYLQCEFACHASVHLDVAYICFGYTRVFSVFQMYVVSVLAVSDVCCKCFI